MAVDDPACSPPWRLKRGAHALPGRRGCTCINELAIVAAGYPHRPVRLVEQMPACFSRPICRLALCLNDRATDEQRQRLLPFATRLACADSPEVEGRREAYIAAQVPETAAFDGSCTVWLPRAAAFDHGLAVLEGAIALGREAEPVDARAVEARLAAARSVGGRLHAVLRAAWGVGRQDGPARPRRADGSR